jgi:hypothetical protein
MTTIELRAYEIGIKEANEQRRIVPACKSKRMMSFLEEIRNDLLPLIKAYDEGIAYEINRQTRLEF